MRKPTPTTAGADVIHQTSITQDAGDDDGALARPIPGDGALQLGGLAVDGPKGLVRLATEVAGELARVIEDRGLTVNIKGRPYVKCEGWTTCAAMLGVTAREVSVEERDDGSFVAVVELARVADGQVVGRGSAVCGPDEPTWKGRPRYAIRSMATTRATGKACRLAFSWIVTLAGYAATPAEEVEDLGERGAAKGRTSTPRTSHSRVLGDAGAGRLRDALAGCGRSFDDLLRGLRDHEADAYPVCSGVEVAEIPVEALDAIGRQLERFRLDAVDESKIPF